MAGRQAATDREIFQQALALAPEERAAYLDEACRDDAALRGSGEREKERQRPQ